MNERQSFSYRIGAIMPVTEEKKLAHVVASLLLEHAMKEGTALQGVKEALILSHQQEKIVLETLESIVYYHKGMGGID